MALTDKLTAIGNAIREKTGGTDLLTLDQMPAEISNIQGGGTVEELTITSNGTYNPPTGIDGYAPVVVNVPQDGGPPAEALVLTGDCAGLFQNNKFKWFLDMYGKQITTNRITHIGSMFYGSSSYEEITIDIINMAYYRPSMDSVFCNCSKLKKVPKIKLANIPSYPPDMVQMFKGCSSLRELPNDYFTGMIDDWDTPNKATSGGSKASLFESCYSLRTHPDMTCFEQNYAYCNLYYYTFRSCSSLDEVSNFSVLPATLTDNTFDSFVSYCNRLKNMTFRKNEDGSPVVANWKNQTIDLSQYIGYANYVSNITGWNSGITADKQVSDDATYQALKNDPDWFSGDINYSRYNHDSAVNTINSLPDTSAYLATAGGTNTIKFSGASGASTDGGAINTLTEEEIAVATAKGWTVSLS